jgi:hypothetical protein
MPSPTPRIKRFLQGLKPGLFRAGAWRLKPSPPAEKETGHYNGRSRWSLAGLKTSHYNGAT